MTCTQLTSVCTYSDKRETTGEDWIRSREDGMLTRIFKQAIRHIMHMVVFFTVEIYFIIQNLMCRLSFRVFSIEITWLVKYGRDFKTRKVSSIEQISANGLDMGALTFKI